MLSLEESLEEVPNSDISIYQLKPTRPSFVEKKKQEQNDIKYQKIWVSCHSIIFILIACETLYLLVEKVGILRDFYNTQEQCCYCAWIARNGIFNDEKRIDYSHCDNTYAAYNSAQICEINDTQYCQNNMLRALSPVSTTSTFLFYKFRKFYPYYGIVSLLLVVLYSFFIIIATFKHKFRLSSLLFVGNIVIAIQLYYNYIKAYQYTKKKYSPTDAICANDALPEDSYETACYQNTVGTFTEELLTIMVDFFMIYFIYPLVFYVLSCFIKRCSYGYKCSVIQGYIERVLLYIGVIGGLMSIVLCFAVLVVVITRTENDEFIANWFDQPLFERYLCLIIGATLFTSTLSVFCLPHCRSRCKLMIRARKIPNWKETIFDHDEDECDNFQQYAEKESVDMTGFPSKTMHSKPQSPLLNEFDDNSHTYVV